MELRNKIQEEIITCARGKQEESVMLDNIMNLIKTYQAPEYKPEYKPEIIMRIKDGSISRFGLECELRKILDGRMKNCVFDIKRIFNYNGFLSKYNYDIAIIEKNGDRGACTVEGFASNFNCKEILDKFPFNI